MSDLTIKMQELVKRCQAILDAMFSREPRSASPKTQVEYERQAQQLLQRARHVEGGLFYVVQSTTSASTFRKRLIAPDGQVKFPHPWPPQIPPGRTTRL